MIDKPITCQDCGTVLTSNNSYYPKHRQKICKDCRFFRIHQREKIDYKIDYERQIKTCSKCKKWLPFSEFKKQKKIKCGLDSWCKKCHQKKGIMYKPNVCLSCNSTHFEVKPYEFTVETEEVYVTMKTDTWKCQECGTPVMNTEQMDTMRQLLDLTNSKENTKHET